MKFYIYEKIKMLELHFIAFLPTSNTKWTKYNCDTVPGIDERQKLIKLKSHIAKIHLTSYSFSFRHFSIPLKPSKNLSLLLTSATHSI